MFHVCSNVLLISSSFFGSIASSYYFSVVSFCFLASFISFLMCNLVFFIWTLPPTSTALSYINCSKSSNVVALSFVSLCCKCCWYLLQNVSEIIFYEILFSLLILSISFCIFIVIVVWSVLFVPFTSEYSLLKNEGFHWGFLQKIWPNPQFSADLVTFTEEILNEKLHFLYSDSFSFITKLFIFL